MEIRNFADDDAGDLSDLILAVYDESPISSTFKSKPTMEHLFELSRKKGEGLRNGYLIDLVATIDGKVVADCEIALKSKEEGTIGIVVAKEHRRKRIGSKLVERCIANAKKRGVRRIYAEINKENRIATLFFSKCNFEKQKESEESIVMAKNLL
ncbi:MAG: GNAT family N-acetyltransferase [Candidatus Micrarchaeales archaeon]|jgi:ribosomal protein S18 acetylase RimI-like enzyme